MTTKIKEYDLIIIGAGSSGLTLASRANGNQMKTLLINPTDMLGGECLHSGCVPTKSLLKATKMGYKEKEINQFIRSKQKVIQEHELPTCFPGIDFAKGYAQFSSPKTVNVAGEEYSFKKAVICCGSKPFIPPIKGLDEIDFLTNENLFEHNFDKKNYVIIGAGVIGMEIAYALSLVGKNVTVIDNAKSILLNHEPIVTKTVFAKAKQSVEFHLSSKVDEVIKSSKSKHVIITDQNGQKIEIPFDELLIATGRMPNIEKLDLDAANIKYQRYIKVNKHCRTSNENVYASGDIIGAPQFSHTAYHESKTVWENITKKVTKIDYRFVPSISFVFGEIFSIGKTTSELETLGVKYNCIEVWGKSNDRNIIEDENDHLVINVDVEGNILGATIFGNVAGEYGQLLIPIMNLGCKIGDITKMTFPYPSRGELIHKAARIWEKNYEKE